MTDAGDDGRVRCGWATFSGSRSVTVDSTMYRDYHDTEWGRPLRGSQALLERVSLEAFQSGLSWITILKKRENFRTAFEGFDVAKVAAFTGRDVERLMGDEGIVRNLAKINATINNARVLAGLDVDFGELLWSFAPPRRPRPADM